MIEVGIPYHTPHTYKSSFKRLKGWNSSICNESFRREKKPKVIKVRRRDMKWWNRREKKRNIKKGYLLMFTRRVDQINRCTLYRISVGREINYTIHSSRCVIWISCKTVKNQNYIENSFFYTMRSLWIEKGVMIEWRKIKISKTVQHTQSINEKYKSFIENVKYSFSFDYERRVLISGRT